MKIYLVGAIVAVLAVSVCGSAQSVVITPRKVVYHRPKPIDKLKRTFTITYPKVKKSKASISKKIESAISYKNVLQLDLREELNGAQWLEEASYAVNYNARGILVVTLSMNGMAAYPDGVSKTVAVDLSTGVRITPVRAFTRLNDLVELVRIKQQAEIKSAIEEMRKDPDLGDEDPAPLFAEEQFVRSDLEQFAIDDRGVTFFHDYGFPHVIQALEPEGRYRYSWDSIAAYVNSSGPFAKFVRNKH